MTHHKIKSNNSHYAVGYNSIGVLLQLGEDREYEEDPARRHEQIRIKLTMEEVDHLIQLLQDAKINSKNSKY